MTDDDDGDGDVDVDNEIEMMMKSGGDDDDGLKRSSASGCKITTAAQLTTAIHLHMKKAMATIMATPAVMLMMPTTKTMVL